MANPPTAPVRQANFTFPSDLTDQQKNYAVSFTFYQYQRDSLEQGAKLQPAGQGSTILLPMPDTINDNPVMSWGRKSFNPAESAARTAQGFWPFSQAAKVMGFESMSAGGGYLFGVIPNPILIAVFESPDFKEFEFSWTLAPRTKQESETLHSIVQSFKKYMLPTKKGNFLGTGIALGLGYPNIVKAQFIPDDFLFQMKPMAIKSCSVNYAPSGPAFFKDTGAPAAVNLRLGLMELEYWTQEDYQNTGGFS